MIAHLKRLAPGLALGRHLHLLGGGRLAHLRVVGKRLAFLECCCRLASGMLQTSRTLA